MTRTVHRDIVVIAASAGGLEVLKQTVQRFPADLAAAVFIVLHIGAHPSILPQILQKHSVLPVRHPSDGEDINPSVIYVAPSDRHIILNDGRIVLSSGPKENFARPAADPLFRSAAVAYGSRVVGTVLSGHLDDGSAGLKAVWACGGYTVVQTPSDCSAPSMPASAIRSVPVDVIAPASEIGTIITEAVMGHRRTKADHVADPIARRTAEVEVSFTMGDVPSPDTLNLLGERSSLTCPDCGGVLWRVGRDRPLRYRCHTGHAFSELSIAEMQYSEAEDALWRAMRRFEEMMMLTQEQATLASLPDEVTPEPGSTFTAARIQQAIDTIRNLLLAPDQ
jgi:two-component system, chemotaxis family, protein-glutamate methylesterase/glutaminase